jgi:hypothetical protein
MFLIQSILQGRENETRFLDGTTPQMRKMAVKIANGKKVGRRSTKRCVNCRGLDCPVGYCVVLKLRRSQQLLDIVHSVSRRSPKHADKPNGVLRAKRLMGQLSEVKRFDCIPLRILQTLGNMFWNAVDGPYLARKVSEGCGSEAGDWVCCSVRVTGLDLGPQILGLLSLVAESQTNSNPYVQRLLKTHLGIQSADNSSNATKMRQPLPSTPLRALV